MRKAVCKPAHRSSDTFHKTGLTALGNASFSNEKADWMDAEREQGEAMGGLWLRIGFLTPPPTNGRVPAVDALPFLDRFVLGTDPHAADPGLLRITGPEEAEFIVRDLAAHDGISWQLESSETLADPWQARPDLPQVAADPTGVPAGFTRMRCKLEAGHPRFFLRLRAFMSP